MAELAGAADPDMALNNLERYAAAVDHAVFFRTLAEHPGAAHLLARLGGSSQFLADALRRRPSGLAWLLEPRTMRVWFAEDFAADLAQSLQAFPVRDARANALRRFKYRHLLRIGARDLLGDADLSVSTEELARLADSCLGEAWRMAEAEATAKYGAPLDEHGQPTGLAVIGMGKLGGEELNYSSDIDLMFVYGAEGDTAGGPEGTLANGEYFARVCRDLVAIIESVTEEGYVFRVDLRLRPEGRMGAIALSLDAFASYHRERAELWERQALLKARVSAGDARVGARFMEWARETVYRPGLDERVVPAIRSMKESIDHELGRRGQSLASNVKLGRGGIREIEFIVQALQLLYGGDDSWLREPNSLKALFRLTERGYLAPDLGRTLSHALVHLRTVEHRLQLLDEFQTHTLPTATPELGRLARRLGIEGTPAQAARAFGTRHRAVTSAVHRAFVEFFRDRPAAASPRLRLPGLTALRATGFADPERARQNLRLILEGRPLVPYAGALRAALERVYPTLLDALWKSPDPDEALNQLERFLSAAGPRAGYIELLADNRTLLDGLVRLCAGGDLLTQLLITQPELLASLADERALTTRRTRAGLRAALAAVFAPATPPAERRDRLRRIKQAEELTIVWRYLLGVTSIERYAREMTALAEATLHAGWLLALGAEVERHGVPRDATGRFVPAVIVGVGKLGGRELTTGSDLDLFVLFDTPRGGEGTTDGEVPVDVHTFYSAAVERLAGALGDITPAGVAFAVDLRIRPGSKGSGFAASLAAAERYYEDHGDLWERQTLTRARLLIGDRGLARQTRALLRRLVYGVPLPASGLKEIGEVRTRMELELGKETPGRLHVKLGRGGLVDVEFLAQALQLVHGAAHADVRRPSTPAALAGLARAGALPEATVGALTADYRFLRRVSTALRLLGARPTDTLELAGPMPARVASALGFPSREAFLTTYRERTTAVRAAYDRIFRQAMPDDPTPDDRAPDHPKPGHSMPGHSTPGHSTPVERSRPPSETAHPRPYPSKRHPLQ
ncbi:MAG TPA: bifunctional [glutamate--ammonia ligase]-adenylyl-L-tyrosine phosphorylase/[glutamate--ammonia-ligase] adenylyltransferase [Methylomirabilota bacterium]|nr:bifunctional [glutamate--ammonia ligase]-adenylyl-L-tyrosine phosphorylase/[glutamate--ammonia-ligase] adenylyltransferase [Methylomirabilota bacterium]